MKFRDIIPSQVAMIMDNSGKPRSNAVLLSSDDTWRQVTEEIKANPAFLKQLTTEAENYLSSQPLNLVDDKKHIAPSGTPHDYISIGTYWWPDPNQPDGLPWIRKDGQVTPTFFEYDNIKMELMYDAVSKLILYALVADSASHARHAGKFLRAWFIDEATRMNPHLRYAQFIPGLCEGRCIGLIDTMMLVFLIDAVNHLKFNEDWTPTHLNELKKWLSQYLDWLLNSKLGKEEESQPNNHGTWYDAQIVCFAAFCDRPGLAMEQIENLTKPRISEQIAPDGSQPHELSRTLSLTYCTHNLLGYACIARIAGNSGVDLWNWQSANGRSLKSALQWMQPYLTGEIKWTDKQIKPFDSAGAVLMLTLAGLNSVPAIPKIEEYPWQRILFQRPATQSIDKRISEKN